jgi:hypothetical protein
MLLLASLKRGHDHVKSVLCELAGQPAGVQRGDRLVGDQGHPPAADLGNEVRQGNVVDA